MKSFSKQLIFIIIGLAVLVAGGVAIYAVNNRGAAPVGWWKFDEGYASSTYDASGNANTGTMTGGVQWKNEESCKNGKCLRFDGANDYVGVTRNTILEPASAFSIETWVKVNAFQDSEWNTSQIISKYGGNYKGYILSLNKVGSSWYFYFTTCAPSACYGTSQPTQTVSLGQWYHLVAVFQNGSPNLMYINGILVGQSANAAITHDTAQDLLIGKAGWYSSFFNGSIDDTRVYNYARSANQIKADYNKSAGGKGASMKVASLQEQQNASDGLVGYWKMDEASWAGAAGEVVDSSGAGNNGTATGANTTSTAKFGMAGSFDGTDDYVDAGNAASLNITGDITISAWVKSTKNGAWQGIVKKSSTPEYNGYGLFKSLTNYFSVFGGVYSDNAYTDQDWHFLVAVNQNGRYYLYVDGVKQNGTVAGIPTISAQNLQIGRNYGNYNGEYFQGQIDDVKIYNKARSAEQIRRDYETGPPPAAHWRMDEKKNDTCSGGANDVCDTSGNGNDGAISGAAWKSAASCKIGSCLKFDGTDDYVSVASVSNLGTAGPITVSAWIKPSDLGDGGIIGKYDNVGYNSYALWYGSGLLYFQVGSSGVFETKITSAAVSSANVWYYVVGVYDKSNVKLYVDGKEVASASENRDIGILNYYPFCIGSVRYNCSGSSGYNETAEYFNGSVDDVRIYNYARTPKQIMEDMNAGHPAVGSPVGSYVAYWPLDEGQGTVAYDSSVNKSNCTMSGTSYWTVNGKFGKAFNASGDDIATCPYIAIDNRSFSVSGWIKFNSLSGDQPLLEQNGGTTNLHLHLLARSSKLLFAFYANDLTGNTTLATGQWYYVTFVYQADTNRREIYLNGVLDAQDTSPSDYLGASGSTVLGKYLTNYLNGLIDELKIYQFALSPAEIKEEFNRGVSLKLGASGTESDGITPSNSSLSAYCVPGDTSACAAPVAHWKIDEKTGQYAYDTSGNGNTGTVGSTTAAEASDPTWKSAASCHSGACLKFDGTDDYVNIADTSAFKLQQFSISAWFKVSDYSVTRSIFGNVNSSFYYGYYLDVGTDGKIYFSTSNSTGNLLDRVISNTIVATGSWYHVIVTLDGSTIKMYVNGVYDNQDSSQQTLVYDTTHYPTIGRNTIRTAGGYQRFFSGFIDDVRIYNYARTPAQIAWDYNRGGPVGSWSMDSVGVSASPGTALNIYDSSGNANTGVSSGETMNNGTLTGGPTWKDGSNCKYGSCLSFDGSNDYVSSNIVTTQTTNITMSIWVYWRGITQSAGIFYNGNSGSSGYGLYVNNGSCGVGNKVTLLLGGVNCDALSSTYVLPTNQWVHLTLTRDATTWRLYVNGVLVVTGGTTNPNTPTGSTLIAGGESFNGLIDDARIYNTALTATQVAALYNNNDRAAGASLETNLVGEWRLDENASLYAADTHYQRIGKYGYAMNFDGSNDYVDAGNAGTHLSNITVSAWIKPNAVGDGVTWASDGIVNKYTTVTYYGWKLGLDSSGYATWVYISAVGGSCLTDVLTDSKSLVGSWHHVVGVRSSAGLLLYVDGLQVGSRSVACATESNNEIINIGGPRVGGASGEYFNGQIDDVRVYNYALNATQIKTLFNENSAVRFGPTEGLP